jgi:two-component system cell cycle sensor histidine kinase/response regulator CckA
MTDSTANTECVRLLLLEGVIRSALDCTSRQAKKMESLGKLTGGLLHDFNNLLMIIRGCAELLQVHQNDPQRAGRYIQQIQDATSVAASGVLRLMILARGEATEAGIVDLNSLLGEIAQILPRLLGERIQIDFKHNEAPVLVRADRNEMEQVALMLALSAADAMPRGGTLKIETRQVAVYDMPGDSTNLAPGAYVRMTVGDAKALKAQPQPLKPFLAGSASENGTGLGLAAAHSIVKQSGGDVVVECIPGYGNILKVFFPAALPVEASKPAQRVSATAAVAKNTGTFGV